MKLRNIKCRPTKFAFAIAACSAAFLAVPAAGQQGEIEEISVTGSLLRRPANRPQPVTIIDSETIGMEHRTSIAEILRDLPANQSADIFQNVGESGDAPTATVNLRGLGARATLPLLNGRRQTIDATAATGGVTAVDVNNLVPSIMIERVEVLTDGASATYGTDAVAGVVNFITRQNFEGMELSFQGVNVDQTDTNDYIIGGILGIQDDNAGIVIGIEYEKREAISTDDLFPLSRLLTGNASAFGNPGTFQPGGFPTRRPDPDCGSEALGGSPTAGIPDGQFCRLLLSKGRGVISDVERLTSLMNAHYNFSSGIEANFEVGFSRNRQYRQTGFSFPLFGSPVVPASNPGVIAANAQDPVNFPIQDYTLWHRVGSPVTGALLKFMNSDTWRIGAGLTGESLGWNWDLSATMSENDSELLEQDTHFDRVIAALNCQGGADGNTCYNPFGSSFTASPGDSTYNEPGIVDWMMGFRNGAGNAQLTTIDAVFSRNLGELAGGPIGFAIGGQWREQDFTFGWDSITNNGGWAFNTTPLLNFSGSRDVWSLFSEIVLFPTDTLEFQIAARYEDYGSVDSFNPKVSALWTPVEGVFVRASAGTSFRIPGELETIGSLTGGLGNAELNGQLVEARGVLQGNPDLEPEEGENWNIGITWDVTDNFSMRFDYWGIQFDNIVVPEDGEDFFLTDIADGTIDSPRIFIDPRAGTNVVADLAANDIVGFELSYVNRNSQDTEGIDFGFDWSYESGANQFGITIDGTYYLHHRFDDPVLGTSFDTIGTYEDQARPDWQTNTRFNWGRGEHFAQVTVRNTPKLTDPDGLAEEFDYMMVDLMYAYSFTDYGLDLRVGIRNMLDEDSPVNPGNLTTVIPRLYDPRGRLYNLGLKYSF